MTHLRMPSDPGNRSPHGLLGQSAIALESTRISSAPDIGHSSGDARVEQGGGAIDLTPTERERFHALYREHFDFVFRNLRRLGIAAPAIDDALQEVYLVALRRIADYREGASAKAWLFAIAKRIAGNHRRSQRRLGEPMTLAEERIKASQPGPFELVAQEQARRILHDFLETLDENRRAVFVLAELEQLSAPEIAQALSANLNTVYSWLRVTRCEFARWVERRGPESKVRRG